MRFFCGLVCLLLSVFEISNAYSQNIAVNTTGTAAAAGNLFEVTQPAGAANNSVSIFASHLGTGTNAYAIWAEATGATNKYAIVVPNGGGAVGIGTTTPSGLFHVASSLPNYIDRMSNSSNEGASFIFRKARGTVAAPAAIQNGDEIAKFLVSAYDGSSYIWTGGMSAVVNGTVAAGSIPTDLVFGTSAAHMGNPTGNEAMRITSAKNVGIGTTAPTSLVSISTTGTELTGTAMSASLKIMSGNLGGVAGNELSLASIGFTSGNQTALGIRAYRTANGATWGTTAIGLGMDVDNTIRAGASLWLNANTFVGIGTASPSAKLHVVNSTTRQIAAYDWLDMSSTGGGYGMLGGNSYMNWGDNTMRYSNTHGSIGAIGFATNYPAWNQASVFSSGTTSAVAGNTFSPTMIAVFDYSGKVGIGTSSPATKLDIQGTSGTTLKIVDGNQGAGKVLTSDAAGVASWSNSPYASGSGNMVMLHNDETSAGPYTMTTASIKSFTIPATYTKVKVEAEVEDDGNTAGIWSFSIVYNGVAVRTIPMYIVTTSRNVLSLSYTGAISSGQVVRIDATQTSGKNVYVRNFRVYGIY